MIEAFITYLEEQAANHSIYVWGAQGQQGGQITASWIRKKETSPYNAGRAIAFWRKQVAAGYGQALRAFDCSGLAVYFLLKHSIIPEDMTANGLMRACKAVSKEELRPGDFVFRLGDDKKAYHVGYVTRADTIIQAKGRDEGVVETPLKGWNAYGRPAFFDDPLAPRTLKLQKPYLYGEDVLLIQTALAANKSDPGPVDGVYGPITQAAVRVFQTHLGFKTDGVVRPETRKALLG